MVSASIIELLNKADQEITLLINIQNQSVAGQLRLLIRSVIS